MGTATESARKRWSVAAKKYPAKACKTIAKRRTTAPRVRRHSGIKNGLAFGRRCRPSQIVVVLHGLNDSAADCASCVAKTWTKGLPEALIVVPESPDKSLWGSWDKTPGYDWVATERPPPWDALEEHGLESPHYKASLKEYQAVLRARCRGLHKWLDALLMKHGLTNKDLVLVGFSLGAYLSAIVGAERNARGVIVAGGMCTIDEVGIKDFMPKQTRSQFCAVNGTKDYLVHRPTLEATLKRYKCEYHWSPGVGHDFPNEWYATELEWMQRLFQSKMQR